MLCMYMQWDLQHHAHMHPCMHACCASILLHAAAQETNCSHIYWRASNSSSAWSLGSRLKPQSLCQAETWIRRSCSSMSVLAARVSSSSLSMTGPSRVLLAKSLIEASVYSMESMCLTSCGTFATQPSIKPSTSVLVLKTPWRRTSLMQKTMVGQGMSSGQAMPSSICICQASKHHQAMSMLQLQPECSRLQ